MQILNPQKLNDVLDDKQWPFFQQTSVDDTTMLLTMTVRENLSYFAGHFPQQAVLPGVVQIHWASELAKLAFSCQVFCKLKSVKFSNTILPAASIKLSLEYQAEKKHLRFKYFNKEQRFSSGIIVFREDRE